MSEIKPSITTTEVLTLLQGHFTSPVTQLTAVQAGQVARTFSFRVAEQAYIIRFNSPKLAGAFAKEKYIFDHFSSPLVPVPTIVDLGEFQTFSFAIAHKLPGVLLNKLPPTEYKQLMPAVVATLDAIHQVDVRHQPGFGHFNQHGSGESTSWHAHLTDVREEEPEDQFFGKWHHLFDDSFLKRGFFEAVYEQMSNALVYCPEERYLVHGDYGFDNVLVEGGIITGVLDWANAKYGDFLYDVAWLDLWSPDSDFQGQFRDYYLAHERPVSHYTERIHCYQAYMGLNALRFFAKAGNRAAYGWVRERMVAIFPQIEG